MIAIVEDEDLGALRDLASDADGKAIGVGGGQCELPVGQAETLFEIFANVQRVFRRKHQRNSLTQAAGNRFGNYAGRMTCHRASIAEAEIDVIMPVNALKMSALGFGDEHREGASPLFHPVHGDAAEQ